MRGRAFVRLFPDVHAPVGDEPPDLALRSTGAYASCGPADAPAEIIVPGGGVHPCPGLVVRRDSLLRDEVQRVAGVPVTTPRRTAYDLARRCPDLVDAVVAVDALSRQGRFDPEQVLRPAGRYPRARGRRRLPRVVDLSDRRSGSSMETRLRLLLVLRGLPRPEVQWVVQDVRRRRAVWLDLAYPEQHIGVEYEGAEHTRRERVLRDVGRGTDLVDQGPAPLPLHEVRGVRRARRDRSEDRPGARAHEMTPSAPAA